MANLSNEEIRIAKSAVEENEKLRRLLDTRSSSAHVNNDYNDDNTDLDSVFMLTRKNDVLKGEISDLQDQLAMYDDVSPVDVVLEYKRLDAKRGYLRNEVQSLRNVRNHQVPKVREANRILNDQQLLKKRNDEKNKTLKYETKLLKERRDKEIEDLCMLNRKEASLKDQLENVAVPPTGLNQLSLKADIVLNDKVIRKLGEEIQSVLASKRNEPLQRRHCVDTEVRNLREEYATLHKRKKDLQIELDKI